MNKSHRNAKRAAQIPPAAGFARLHLALPNRKDTVELLARREQVSTNGPSALET
jgi:hypothetical protein